MNSEPALPDLLKNLIANIDRLEANGCLRGEGLRAARKEMEALDAYVGWFMDWKTKTAVPEGTEPTPQQKHVMKYQQTEFEEPIRAYIERCRLLYEEWAKEPPGSPSN